MLTRRSSGVLLHITSLPSRFGIGDFGPGARGFLDFLESTHQTFWQVLPLNPTRPGHANSPYSSTSAFALNPWLISPEGMVEAGWLSRDELASVPDLPDDRVDYRAVERQKRRLFRRAHRRFREGAVDLEDFERWRAESSYWLEDYALFAVLETHFGGRSWRKWPPRLRDRKKKALREARASLADEIDREVFLQYAASRQWADLQAECRRRGVRIMGDLPIYVDYESADVWSHPETFQLDPRRRPTAVAGVPPDYFSSTGQLWGNPLYRWDFLRKTGYRWWIQRMRRNLELCDVVRLDHFRGLVAYWSVPARARTAKSGRWVEGPVTDFLDTLLRTFSHLPIIAEDLGVITPDVREVMREFELPGMRLLLFAFGGDAKDHPYLPHLHVRNCVVYTGTHDNNTARGWFRREADRAAKEHLFGYVGRRFGEEDAAWELVRLAFLSVADLAIVPLQDVLGLGAEARMNRPATIRGNWLWRVDPALLRPSLVRRFGELTRVSARG